MHASYSNHDIFVVPSTVREPIPVPVQWLLPTMEDGVRLVHRWQENDAVNAKRGPEQQPATRPNFDGATSDCRMVVLTGEGIDFFSTAP
ncbi:hypothetical protein SeLEV6574_g08547, partial [Synchytrium endobioticum]